MRVRAAQQDLAFAAIERAAAGGEPCPKNDEIAHIIGASSPATGARIVATLERRGLIRVERFGRGREVTIVASGKSTAGYPGTRRPHFSLHRKKGPSRSRAAAPQPVAALPPDAQVRVYRDPCFRCGVRGDIGCAHQAANIA